MSCCGLFMRGDPAWPTGEGPAPGEETLPFVLGNGIMLGCI